MSLDGSVFVGLMGEGIGLNTLLSLQCTCNGIPNAILQFRLEALIPGTDCGQLLSHLIVDLIRFLEVDIHIWIGYGLRVDLLGN